LLARVLGMKVCRFVLLYYIRITMPKKAEMIGMTATLVLVSA